MLNVSEVIKRRPLGSGCFNVVYAVGAFKEKVLVIAASVSAPDKAKYEYLRMCAARLKVYGLRHEKMRGLPEVFEVGVHSDGRRYAIVRRYAMTLGHREQESQWLVTERLTKKWQGHHKDLGIILTDSHGGNWMWCPTRGQYVMIDPTTDYRNQGRTFSDTARRPNWKH